MKTYKPRFAGPLACLALLVPLAAHADPALDAALAKADQQAAVYKAGQPVELVDGYVPGPTAGGLSASVPYDQEVIGSGEDLITGTPRKLCFVPGPADVQSTVANRAESALTVVRSDYDLQSFFSSISDVSAAVNVGSLAAHLHASVGIEQSLHMQTADLAVIAQYTYTTGQRWYSGEFALAPAYDTLRQQSPTAFMARCGHGFLAVADNGISMLVIYHLHQRQEVHASDDEIKATFSIRYGLSTADGSETLSNRQREVYNAYDVSSRCFVSGADAMGCELIKDSNQVETAWKNLTSQYDPTKAVALRTGFQTYAAVLNDPRLDVAAERVRLTQTWDDRLSWIEQICNSVDNLPQECSDAKAGVLAMLTNLDDIAFTGLREPSFADGLPVFVGSEIGHAYAYEHINGGGRVLDIHFSANPAVTDALHPGVLYNLGDYSFGTMLSSGKTAFENPLHWTIDFFSSTDGSGTPWSLNAPYTVNVPHDFNDQARSFRLRYVP